MASPRRAVTDALERLAFAAELLDDDRARRFGAASWAIRNLDGDVAAMHASGELKKIRGVGEATYAFIGEVLEGKKPERLRELEGQLPDGLFAIRRVKGLGPKKVKQLWRELGIESLAELEYACVENRLVDLKGFGKKTQDAVLKQLRDLERTAGMHRRDRSEAILGPVVEAVDALGLRVAVVGDHARGLELVRELGVVVAAPDDASAAAARAAGNGARPPEVDVAVHVVSPDAFGAAQVWHTSSEAHREALRERAEGRGLTFTASGLEGHATPDEEALYRALDLVPTAPERREPGVPLVEVGKARPKLVTRADLRGALHNHTTASDGSASLEDMQEAAAEHDLEYLGITDHSHTASYARGLDAERLSAQLDAIRALDDAPCAILTGVESDILPDGALDYDDALLARLDVVVASVHRRHAQDRAAMTARLVAAASHRFADVIGHPTGRLLLGRAPVDVDMEAFLDACAARSVAVELNANPARLDLSAEHLAMAKERGVLVSISADAHSTGELENLAHGVAVARRAGLTAEDVLNTRTRDELMVWVAARRAR